jgi:diguanylate cyclase (GGDEF)-like protein
MDLNGLKSINDSLGHLVGDQALRDAAMLIRQTFRGSDIVGRLGGDEFVALAHVSGDLDALTGRIREHIAAFNATSNRPYHVEFSLGTAVATGGGDETIESLIGRADAAMYEDKRATSQSRTRTP